ncbi:MAG: hypothetical protein IBJ09_01875 [Bacteroidia bacterium]|nr:hypothetical protein [Bacteroidia bacterium]
MHRSCKTVSFWAAVLSLVLVSCGKEKPPVTELPSETDAQGVVILCEGNFGMANARIDYYDKSDGAFYANVFTAKNNRPLGDVVQSALMLDQSLYVVVNNSGKIEKMSRSDFKSEQTATGFMSPRFILPVNATTAYVSDLYADKLYVVGLPGMNITGSVSLPGWTEEMVLAEGKVFVCNYEKNYVYVINTQQHSVTDSIFTGSTPGSVVKDKYGKLWALCGGNLGQTSASKLVQIDPATHTILQNITLDAQGAFKIRINQAGERLYFLGSNKIYTMGVSESTPQVFFGESGHNWYGLRVDPQTGHIWAADALSYNQDGKVYILKPDGSLDRSVTTGVIPTDFLFY